MSFLGILCLNDEDRFRLIKMVQEKSILWDSRLSIFKGADGLKLAGWTQIGKELKLHPQKAERCFKRCREMFRKELAKHKRFGDGFKSKWEFYDAMSFLRPIIKERKSALYRDDMMPLKDYNYKEEKGDDQISSTAYTGMVEIPVKTEVIESNLLKLRSNPEEESPVGRKSRLDLHEKFGNFVTSKLNTLGDFEADKQMKIISQLMFD